VAPNWAQPRPQFGFLPWLAFFLALSLRFTVRFDIRRQPSSVGMRVFAARPEPSGLNDEVRIL
jgi:hypothetical protein